MQEQLTKLAGLRSNVPVRVLNKATVFLVHRFDSLLATVGANEECTRLMLLNAMIFRSWFNSERHFSEAVRRYQAYGVHTVCGVFALDFNASLWLQAASEVKTSCGTFRNPKGYNPGSGGAFKGERSVDAVASKIADVLAPTCCADVVLQFLPTSGSGNGAKLLTWLQNLCGKFVGYQIALDLGYVKTAWFDQAAVLHVGPGAVGGLADVFPALGATKGAMERDETLCDTAIPFVRRLTCIVQGTAGTDMQDALRHLGCFVPDVADVEYWLCELRQLDRDKPVWTSHKAESWYMEALRCQLLTSVLTRFGLNQP